MASLDRHTQTIDAVEHAALAFRADCPYCRRARLAGSAPPAELVPPRAKASLAAGLMALSAALPASAAAGEPLTEIEPPAAAQDNASSPPAGGGEASAGTAEVPAVPEVEPLAPPAETTPPATVDSSGQAKVPPAKPQYEAPSTPEYEPPAASATPVSPATPPAPAAPQPEAPMTTDKPEAPPATQPRTSTPAPTQHPHAPAPPVGDGDSDQSAAPPAPSGGEGGTERQPPASGGAPGEAAQPPRADHERGARRSARDGVENERGAEAPAPPVGDSEHPTTPPAPSGGERQPRASGGAQGGAPEEPRADHERGAAKGRRAAPAPHPASQSPGAERPHEREDARDRAHIVQPGESLWLIAKRQLPAGASNGEIAAYVSRLWELNDSEVIRTGDPDLIYPGQELRL